MLLNSLTIPKADFEIGTGWQLKPEGACKGDVCIPLPKQANDSVDVEQLATAMALPLVKAEQQSLWSLGPQSIGNRTLLSAQAPDLELPDINGKPFKLSSLKGQKVMVYAWAPY